MLYRPKHITNSSSSSYVILDALKSLKEARRLIRCAANYEDDDGQHLTPDLVRITNEIEGAIQDYKDHKQLPVEEIVRMVENKEW
jgi:hypothetical protein